MQPQRVAELPHLPGGGGSDRKGAAAAVTQLAVVPPSASTRAHVVALTADAKRVFLFLDTKRRTLRVVASRSRDGVAAAALRSDGGSSGGGRSAPTAGVVSTYSRHSLLVAERATADGALSQLLCVLPHPGRVPPHTPAC